jgi:hypothetical protein
LIPALAYPQQGLGALSLGAQHSCFGGQLQGLQLQLAQQQAALNSAPQVFSQSFILDSCSL